MSSDPINPKHYKHLPVEAIEIIEAAIERAPTNAAAYHQGQVLKYLLRCWEKKGIEDLRKAKWYLDRLVASFDDLLAEASETPIVPPKRYREPNPADLRNGTIACEVRNCDDQAWKKAAIHNIYADTKYRFLVRKQNSSSEARYAQCRIEVAE